MKIKKHLFPTIILGGILLFGLLLNPAFVGALIIVTGPTTTVTHVTDTTTTATQSQYRCTQCRDTTCSLRISSTPCANTCRTNSDCQTPTTTHPLCHNSSCTTTTTQPLCHDIACTKYTCNTNYQCVSASNGEYASLSACQNNCQPPPIRYSCNTSTYQCYATTNGAYATLNDCTTNCKAPCPKYTCNSSYQCVIASNGEYTSLSTCQNNCIAPTRYSCNTSTYQCYVTTNGAYASYNDCVNACQPPVTRYTCNSSYQCVVNSNGEYTSLTSCRNNCVPPPPTRYTCNANYQCVVATNGEYTSLTTCQNNCIAPVRYSCNANYQCYVNTNGSYGNLTDCQTNCQPPLTRYTCNASYQCVVTSNGEYTSLTTCQNNCIAPIRYSCNTSTWQCIVDSSGPYTFLNTCQSNCQAPPENFDFSLTNSGNIIVTKPSYDSISGSNTITANLNGGTAQSVSFSQSGLPYGVSAYSLYSCYPTCSKTNTLTINSSASVGTFQITATATGGGITRTTEYNLIVQDSYDDTISVSCHASPNPAEENQTVTFSSNVSGGSGNYSYYWSGATYGSNSYSQKSFNSDGNYTAYLTVHDSQNRSASTSCKVHIDEPYTNAPTLDLWADKYTINQGESTYLRWTSTNANYCVASTGWTGNKSTNGYESVSPNYDTTYSLTCHGDGGQISRSVTIYVTSTGTNLSLTKLGRNLSAGERVYAKVIRVTQGDVIEFHLTVTAGNNKDLYNVVVKDILPSVLSYIPGTTQINNIVQPDTITTTGLSLGTIYKGTTKTIVFQALSISPGTYLTYTNTAEITADNESKITDSASITYGLVAGAATIKTGAKDSLLISIIVSLISSIMIWYYLKFNPQGKLVLAKVENKIRDLRLEYLRRQMIKR